MIKKPTYEELEQRIKELVKADAEHKQVDEDRDRLLRAIEITKEAVSIQSTDLITVYANDAMAELFGYEKSELIGKHVSILNSVATSDATVRQIKAGIEKDGYWEGETRNKRKDGSEFITYATTSAIKDRDGKILNYISTQHDITERKQIEDAYRNAEARYRTLFEQSPNGILLIDPETGKIIDKNETACKQLGYTRDEFATLKVSDYEIIETPEEIEEHIQKVIRDGSDDFETLQRTKSGEIRNVHVWAKTVQLSDRNLFYVIYEDITDRKQAEDQVKASLKEKEVLLGEIYHRTKNNMQVISGLLSLQSRHFKNKAVLKIFKEIKNRIRAMSLVHQQLYQAKDLSSINLKDYIKDLGDGLLKSYQIEKRRISFHVEGDLVPILIDTAVPFGLIINELISNSLTHGFPDGREGEIRISFHITDENDMEICFKDNGVGLPDGFDLGNTESFGLEIVRNLTENQLGGKVELKEGQGVELHLRFKAEVYKKRV